MRNILIAAQTVFRLISGVATLAAISILLPCVAASAQGDGVGADPGDVGTGGRNTIQGKLYLPSGQRLEQRLRVRLSSVRGGENSTTTDDNGAFTFRRLGPGTYHITVEGGKSFENAGETIDITEASLPRGTQPGQTVTVQIRLEPKRTEALAARPATVNANATAVSAVAREQYEKGIAAAAAGEHKKAVEHLRAAVKIHPEFPVALNELATNYLKLGQLGEASDALRSAVKLAPTEPVLRLNYGVVLLRQKKYSDAETELRRAVELDTTGQSAATARMHRGRALIRLGRGAEAEVELKAAIKLGGDKPSIALAHRYLGALYFERGDDKNAAAELEAYLRLVPNAEDGAKVREILAGLRKEN
jgi:Flp pilus assembly protein TadD